MCNFFSFLLFVYRKINAEREKTTRKKKKNGESTKKLITKMTIEINVIQSFPQYSLVSLFFFFFFHLFCVSFSSLESCWCVCSLAADMPWNKRPFIESRIQTLTSQWNYSPFNKLIFFSLLYIVSHFFSIFIIMFQFFLYFFFIKFIL